MKIYFIDIYQHYIFENKMTHEISVFSKCLFRNLKSFNIFYDRLHHLSLRNINSVRLFHIILNYSLVMVVCMMAMVTMK